MHLQLAELSPGQTPFDWLSVVVVPAVMTVTLGLYAGLLGSRMFAFFQVRTKAVSWLLRLKNDVFDDEHDSPFALSISFLNASHEILTETRGLGHEKLTNALQDVISDSLSTWAKIVGIEYPSDGLPRFPNEETMRPMFAPRGREIFGRLMPQVSTAKDTAHHVCKKFEGDCREDYAQKVSMQVAKIAGTGPDWATLLQPFFFPNYLSENGEIIGLLTRRPSRRAIAAIRINRIWEKLNKV